MVIYGAFMMDGANDNDLGLSYFFKYWTLSDSLCTCAFCFLANRHDMLTIRYHVFCDIRFILILNVDVIVIIVLL